MFSFQTSTASFLKKKKKAVHKCGEMCYKYLNFQVYYFIDWITLEWTVSQHRALIYSTTHSGVLLF